MRWLAALLVVLLVGHARADDGEDQRSTYRVVIDRVEHEPSSIGGNRLRVFVSALTLQGGLIDLTEPKAIKIAASGAEIKAPYALGRFAGTATNLAIVIVVQATLQYQEVLPVIVENLETHVLGTLDEGRTQLAVLPYGEALSSAKLAPLKTGRSKLAQVQSDGTATDPVLLDTVERALSLLKKAKTEPEGRPLRKVVILVGDGRDLSADRERVTSIGSRAAKEGVRIHTFAFAPNDIRRPLLLLGELSKRSFGTFRWIRTAKGESWAPAMQQLRDELGQQYVFTYFLDSDVDFTNKKIKATMASGTPSLNELKVPEPTCAGATCDPGMYCAGTTCAKPKAGGGRGILGWILVIGGGLVGLLVVLWVIGFLMSRRKPVEMDPDAIIAAAAGKSKPPKVASIPPPAMVPASVPPMAAPAIVTGPRFYIVNGPRAGEQIALRHGFLIGKQPGCDLVIDDGYTSSQHAQIGMDHFGNCRVYDRGSTNGTFVNGQRVTEYALEHGMSLRIGSTELRFLAQ